MKFKSLPGTEVVAGQKTVKFDAEGCFETDEKDVIEALKKSRFVSVSAAAKPEGDKKPEGKPQA